MRTLWRTGVMGVRQGGACMVTTAIQCWIMMLTTIMGSLPVLRIVTWQEGLLLVFTPAKRMTLLTT